MPMFDVFISYKRTDAEAVRVLAQTLREKGLQVWLDENRVDDFTSIQRSLEAGLAQSKALVAWYSVHYPQSRACQWELTRAFTTAQREGDPRQRVLLINPESSNAHIHPIELRDALYRGAPGDLPKFQATADAIVRHVAKLSGTFASIPAVTKPTWFGAAGGDGSNRFFGRLAELWQIHSGLWSSEFPAINAAEARPLVRLRGMGGSGKSLTAEVYAIRFGAAYPGGIFWLRAFGHDAQRTHTPEERTVLRDNQFISLAQVLGLATAKLKPAELRQKLAEALAERGPYLWVVDDLASGVSFQEAQTWLAPSANGRTVITTRAGSMGWAGTEVKIEEMGDEDALSLLTHARKPQNTEEEGEARQLVHDLGNHALALELAAVAVQRRCFASFRAYLNETSRDAMDFAGQLLVGQGETLPHRDKANVNLSSTLLLSVAELSDGGRDFLILAAQLAATPIERQVMVQTLVRTDQTDAAAAEDSTDLAMSAVLGQSLAREPSPGRLLVHTLVSRAIRFHAKNEQRAGKLRTGVVFALDQILVAIVFDGHLRADLSEVVDLVDHAEAVLAGKLEIGTPLTMSEAQLFDTLYNYEFNRGNYREARRITERLLAFSGEELGTEHSNTFVYQRLLGNVLRLEGHLDSALACQQNLLARSEKARGELDPETITVVNDLALTYADRGDLARARELQELVLERRLQVQGTQHSQTRLAMENLAATLAKLGENVAAQELLVRAEGIPQPDAAQATDPLTATIVRAETLRSQGDLAGARSLQEEILAKRKQTLGEEHPNSLEALNNLAVTLNAQGEREVAREMMVHVLKLRSKVLGENHPLTLVTLRNLGVMCLQATDYTKAREYLESALAKSSRALGREHVETLSAAYHLVITLIKLNDSSGRIRELIDNELASLMHSDPNSLPADLREIREALIPYLVSANSDQVPERKPWWRRLF
jgi:tetratricopeptide (TPR) repeat protein